MVTPIGFLNAEKELQSSLIKTAVQLDFSQYASKNKMGAFTMKV